MELNREQQRAVEYESGPLLIIAGAGTGKTRVITSRVLHLIHSKNVLPAEILALTFSEKAANEMVARVDEGMPLGYQELAIKTFHAFADQLLRESGMEIGLDPGYKILMPAEQWFFFKKNLFNFALNYYRPLGNPNRFIYALLNHFSKLKDELIEPADYVAYAEKLTDEEGTKTLETALAYQKYQELMAKNNYLDFGDLCFYANRLLAQRDSVREKYQQRFQYILVDEFQDTNYAQFQMVLKLAKAHGNITVVGDDDQSIYKWRGASLSNILQFEKEFPGAEKIVLKQNYRSSQKILDGAYALIQHNNPERLEIKEGIDKKLNGDDSNKEPVEIHQFEDFLQESGFVAGMIKSLQKEQGLLFKDFAILVRANQQTHPFVDGLKHAGLPYQVKNTRGLFSLEEIKDFIALLRVLADPNDDISLLRVLKFDVFKIRMVQILHLLNQKTKLFTALREALGFAEIIKLLDGLMDFSKKAPVGRVINEFLKRSSYLPNLIDNDQYEAIENINEFAKHVARFEKENDENTVVDFVNYLDLLEEANAPFESADFSDRDCVQILTAHGAKGLEFEYVFVVNAVNQRFPGSRRSEPFEIPTGLTREIYPEGDFHMQEERRLFYVAMTRAKRKLFITLSGQYEGNKRWKRSAFAEEILAEGRAKLIEHQSEPDALKRLQAIKEPVRPIFELPKFTQKRLSYSQFDTFKICPLKYNYRYLMKVPLPSFHAENFGTSVHQTLNEFYLVLKRGDNVSLELLKKLYERNWIAQGYESLEHEQARREKGWELLEEFYEKNSRPWVVPEFLEQAFHLKVGDYSISGRIDRIDRLADGTFEVIDYKTGRKKDDEKLEKNLQLSIYALACKEILKIPAAKLSLYYLENNEKVSTVRCDADLVTVKGQILDLIQEMQRSEFMPTPGFHCEFCDFRLICPAV